MAKKSFITMTSENFPHPFPPSHPWELLYSYDEGEGTIVQILTIGAKIVLPLSGTNAHFLLDGQAP